MPSRYEVILADPLGTKLAILDYALGFEYVRVVNDVGGFQVTLPAWFDQTLLRRDYQVQFWRAPEADHLRLDFLGLIRGWRGTTDSGGRTTITAYGVDLNHLLGRRIVNYVAGSAQADMTDQADDMMKAIVTDNLGGDAAATRDLSAYGFSIQGDTSQAPSVTKAFAWRNVLAVLQDLADESWGNGTELFFDVVPLSPTSWQFQTWINQRGRDHTYPGGDAPVIFGLEYGNLEEPEIDFDYTGELTYVRGLGQGEGADRIARWVYDTERAGASVWNRCEAAQDARQCSTTDCVDDAAYRRLAEGRGKVRFGGRLLDTEGTRYGRDWQFGDKVTCTYLGEQFDGVVRMVRVLVGEDATEVVEARLEVVE